MSEQNTTPQVEEVAAANVQPEVSVDAPIVNDNKVVESDEKKPVEEEAVTSAEDSVKPSEEVTQEKPVESVIEVAEKKDESTEEKAVEEKVDDEKVVVEKSDEPVKEEVAVEANGDNHSSEAEAKVVEPTVEETNGVCKRKAENGAEVVEDEKSPKKAKVVDDGDQAPVEETAA